MKTVAILIREPEGIVDKLLMADQFRRSISNIQMFVLGCDPSCLFEKSVYFSDYGLEQNVERYTDMPCSNNFLGFTQLDRSQIAKLLCEADLVIPL